MTNNNSIIDNLQELNTSFRGFDISELDFAVTIIDIVKKVNPIFKEIYKKDAGVWEGYTIEEHTIMVLSMFARYFLRDVTIPLGITPEVFELIIAIHDLGKPKALEKGNAELQYGYNLEIGKRFFKTVDIKVDTGVLDLLLRGSYIGLFLQTKKIAFAKEFLSDCQKYNFNVREAYELIKIFYLCDAGAYTKFAQIDGFIEAKKSLDFLFKIEKGVLVFSPKTQASMDLFKKELSL